MRARLAIALIVVLGSLGVVVGVARAQDRNDVSRARAATAQFHDLTVAQAQGYALLTDAQKIACIDDPAGGMGIHYAKGTLVNDPEEAATTPEALVYQPDKNGRLTLGAVEYVVLKAAWEGAGHTSPPSLFGHSFQLVEAGNRYGLPAFYKLHAWLWKHNPTGMFQDWNPRVTCRST